MGKKPLKRDGHHMLLFIFLIVLIVAMPAVVVYGLSPQRSPFGPLK